MINLANKLLTPFQKTYRYLFAYNFERMAINKQITGKVLSYLSYALLHRAVVMITYPDCTTEIGQITKRISASSFLLKSHDQKTLKVIHLEDIFRIDLE